MTDWIKRPYDPKTDEDGIVYLWLKSYAHARHNVERGANRDSSDAERRYWREHAPVVELLLKCAQTDVLCDPERVHASDAGPPVILAFACYSDDAVHYVSVKRQYARAGFGAEMVRELLGDRLTKSMGFTHELVEMTPKRRDAAPAVGVAVPDRWYDDRHWVTRQFIGVRAA